MNQSWGRRFSHFGDAVFWGRGRSHFIGWGRKTLGTETRISLLWSTDVWLLKRSKKSHKKDTTLEISFILRFK
jgi:hypothetical protein